MQKTLLIVSGPSAVGKRPLVEALAKRVTLEEVLVLAQRDSIFGSTPTRGVRHLKTDELPAITANQAIERVRNRIHMVDVGQIAAALKRSDLVAIVPFYRLALALASHQRVQGLAAEGVRVITVFVSPFSEAEILCCDDPGEVFTLAMQGRDVERTLAEAARTRSRRVVRFAALAAWHRTTTLLEELGARSRFDHRLTMHIGHLPSTWASDPPIGEAGQALAELLAILGV